MKLLIPVCELDNYKSRNKIPLKCEICHKTFYRSKNEIQWSLKCSYKKCLRVCSKKCRSILRNTCVPALCKTCNKSIKRKKSSLRSKNIFCSSSCFAKYNNTHKTTGYRRSKLEKWIEGKLTGLYPKLEIHYNKINTINSELDIYIPSLKLAFELNGIFHYEPIYSEEKLKKTQNNDHRKFQGCLEKKIELCIIDVSKVKYFKPKTSEYFLKIITDIINKKHADSEGIEPTPDIMPNLFSKQV